MLGRDDFQFFWNFITAIQILPCVIETRRYGYIRDSGGCVETPHGATIGCEKSAKFRFLADISETVRNFITAIQILPCVIETQRYGYIRDSGGRVETPHGATIGCEKSYNG